MNTNKPCIVFDLDGTLVDTAPDLAGAMNAVLRHFGRSEVSTDAVRRMVGHGARRTMAEGLRLTGGGTDAMLDEGQPIFLDHYGRNICVESRPFDGVESVLDRLAADAALAVCTNKPVALAEKLIASLGWGDRFAAILGGDSLPVRKPDAAPLYEVIARSGGDPARAAMIGDSSSDMGAARAANIPSVLVSYGYLDAPVADLRADAVIAHFAELPAALRRAAPSIWSTGAGPA
ncbi:phosphoglycolate phosphatase [Pacificimonas sp. WHA3]|uniref:Phosphoglycolate phosphatase n=1 Tax=Pacificimonas pallii TaxID=2827236 RepID=A0ABS6SEK7_9SPHN|nr:HAD family hydrolase [Pacificimonas pallii]MBV7256814.1 phosphoglycolate phosphatase [Pacificimonas pallii]